METKPKSSGKSRDASGRIPAFSLRRLLWWVMATMIAALIAAMTSHFVEVWLS